MNNLRDSMSSPGFWIACGVLARHTVGAWNLHRTLRFLDQSSNELTTTPAEQRHPRLLAIIPVLREQDQIPAAVAWFADLTRRLPGTLEVAFVTTSREQTERDTLLDRIAEHGTTPVTTATWPQLRPAEARALERERCRSPIKRLTAEAGQKTLAAFPSTADALDAELSAFDAAQIRHLHYVGEGRKAAQVNFAARALDSAGADYVAVYDIDSRPSGDLLNRTLTYLATRHSESRRWPEVLQQSARFTTEGTAPTRWQRSLARGASQLQTLWTLRREIPALRRYGTAAQRPARNAIVRVLTRGLAQTVGHGLVVRADVFEAVGGLPENTYLDDVAFGYRLTASGIPVYSLPEILNAPAPEYLSEAIAQSARWSHSYLDYPSIAVNTRAEGRGDPLEHLAALSVAGYRGVTWLLASPATVAATALTASRRTPPATRAMAAAGLWLGVVEPARRLARHDNRNAGVGEIACDSAEIYAAYLVRSLGPIHTAARALLGRTGIGPFSPKTERRNGER